MSRARRLEELDAALVVYGFPLRPDFWVRARERASLLEELAEEEER